MMKTIECETCEGDGTTFEMVCYGGPPVERETDCPDCDGTGEIEVDDEGEENE